MLYGRGTIETFLIDWYALPSHYIVTAADGTVTHVPYDVREDSYGAALAVLGLRRPCQASPVLYALRAGGSWDDGDRWGSAMSWLGEVCDLLDIVGGDIPAACGYRRSPVDDRTLDDLYADNDGDISVEIADLAADYRAGRVTAQHLTTAAKILDRYIDACVRAGLDY